MNLLSFCEVTLTQMYSKAIKKGKVWIYFCLILNILVFSKETDFLFISKDSKNILNNIFPIPYILVNFYNKFLPFMYLGIN